MKKDRELRAALKQLLERLEVVGTTHEELYDTDVREQLFDAVLRSYLRPEPGYEFPETFGMFEPEGNAAVRSALLEYVKRAGARAAEIGVTDPTARLAAFQDSDVETKEGGAAPDEFFGWAESI